ncbi:hypothetical protein ACTFIR_001991 [Dictyostelium discoideum]
MSNTTLCKLPGCGKNVNPGHEFCSRSHGSLFASNKSMVNNTQTQASSNPNSTSTCKLSGCNKAVNPGYDFCERDHGRQHNSNNVQNGASPSSSSQTTTSNQTQASGISNTPTCKLPSCNNAVYPGYEFCRRDHGIQHNSNNVQNGASSSSQTTTSNHTQASGISNTPTCKLSGCNKTVYHGYEFCGRDHGRQYNSNNVQNGASSSSQTTTSNHTQASGISNTPTCKLSGCDKTVYPGHEFCGRDHGRQYNSNNYVQNGASPSSQTQFASNSTPTCKLSGCNKAVYPGYDFCGRDHGRQFNSSKTNNGPASTQTCKLSGCKKNVYQGYEFCGRDHGRLYNTTQPHSFITKIEPTDPKYVDVSKQFTSKWNHKDSLHLYPTVKHIYKVNVNADVVDRFSKKRDEIETRGNFSKGLHKGQPMTSGNEKRRFHGTKSKCPLGINGNTILCVKSTCAVCRIIDTSFVLPDHSNKAHFLRFGPGIYFSSVSSKSNDYTLPAFNGYKYMFLANVLVGKGEKYVNNNQSITAPKPGFDSVLGETGFALNHDELIVYNIDQAKPSYLIIYS